MSKHYTSDDLNFTTFEALDEGKFAINLREEELEPLAETVMFIDVFDSSVKPRVVVMYRDDDSLNYSPNVQFTAEELKDIFAAIMKFLYLSATGGAELAKLEMIAA